MTVFCKHFLQIFCQYISHILSLTHFVFEYNCFVFSFSHFIDQKICLFFVDIDVLNSVKLQEYQEPLRKSDPPILKKDKINAIFYKIPQVLQIHLMLRTELSRLMAEWKSELFSELGNIFVSLVGFQSNCVTALTSLTQVCLALAVLQAVCL